MLILPPVAFFFKKDFKKIFQEHSVSNFLDSDQERQKVIPGLSALSILVWIKNCLQIKGYQQPTEVADTNEIKRFR